MTDDQPLDNQTMPPMVLAIDRPARNVSVLGGQAALPPDRLVDLTRWRRWYRSSRGARHMERWAGEHPALVGWHPTPGAPARFESPISSPRTDAMQAALVSLTQGGDAEAAVALLVQLRPGLVRLVRQLLATRACSNRDAVEEIRAVFFEVLAGHSLERRPSRIAANLLLDTRQRLHRGAAKRPTLTLVPDLPSAATPAADAFASVLAYETLRAAASTLPGSPASRRLTADLGYRAWVLGQPRSDIARELELGPQGVRSRLHRFRAAIRSEYDLQFEYGRSA